MIIMSLFEVSHFSPNLGFGVPTQEELNPQRHQRSECPSN